MDRPWKPVEVILCARFCQCTRARPRTQAGDPLAVKEEAENASRLVDGHIDG